MWSLVKVQVAKVLSEGCPITLIDVARGAGSSSFSTVVILWWGWDVVPLANIVQYCTSHYDMAHSFRGEPNF